MAQTILEAIAGEKNSFNINQALFTRHLLLQNEQKRTFLPSDGFDIVYGWAHRRYFEWNSLFVAETTKWPGSFNRGVLMGHNSCYLDDISLKYTACVLLMFVDVIDASRRVISVWLVGGAEGTARGVCHCTARLNSRLLDISTREWHTGMTVVVMTKNVKFHCFISLVVIILWLICRIKFISYIFVLAYDDTLAVLPF